MKTNRTIPLMLRLSPEERSILDEASTKAGLPTGSYVRSTALAAARKALKEIKPNSPTATPIRRANTRDGNPPR